MSCIEQETQMEEEYSLWTMTPLPDTSYIESMERRTTNLLNRVVLGGIMNRNSPEPARGDTALYRIQFQGRFDSGWSDWFDQYSLSVMFDDETAVTTLLGFVADQAALHGVLAQIRDLGLKLILVEQISLQANLPQ